MKNSIYFFYRGVNTFMEDDYNLDEIKGFVKNYCDPKVDVDQQLKDSAWILLNELNKQPNSEEPVLKEEKKEEQVIPEKKFKKLQNKGQGNSSYFDYAKKQIQTLGMAGVVAMGAGVATQTEVIKKEIPIIAQHIKKEVPIIDQFLTKLKELFVDNNNHQTNFNNAAPTVSNRAVEAFVNASKPKSNESIITEDKSLTEDNETSLVEEAKPIVDTNNSIIEPVNHLLEIQTPFPQPIIVLPVTDVNPPKN